MMWKKLVFIAFFGALSIIGIIIVIGFIDFLFFGGEMDWLFLKKIFAFFCLMFLFFAGGFFLAYARGKRKD